MFTLQVGNDRGSDCSAWIVRLAVLVRSVTSQLAHTFNALRRDQRGTERGKPPEPAHRDDMPQHYWHLRGG